jgi:hypothetical protein
LVVLLQALHAPGRGIQAEHYAALAEKTVEELRTLVRLLMFNPDLVMQVHGMQAAEPPPVLPPAVVCGSDDVKM